MRSHVQVAIFKGHKSTVVSLSFSRDGNWLVSGSKDKTIRIWNMLRNTLKAVITGHTNHLVSICISQDSKWIVSASKDQEVRLWSLSNIPQVSVLIGRHPDVTFVFIRNNMQILSEDSSGLVKIWELVK